MTAKNQSTMPHATAEISAVSSGLFFTSKAEVVAGSITNGLNISKETVAPESKAPTRTTERNELQPTVTNQQNSVKERKVWLYPAPEFGGELANDQKKLVESSEFKLRFWEAIMLLSLFWVSWSVSSGKQSQIFDTC